MNEPSKRHSFRKNTGLSRTVPKGFLKIAREKLNRQMTLQESCNDLAARKHSHKRSKSLNIMHIASPTIRYIQPAQGDF
jgi:hypothetical protein